MQAKGWQVIDVPVGRYFSEKCHYRYSVTAGWRHRWRQVERATPILMAMGSELINCGGPGMGDPR
ncbi:hypothetical protein ACLK19_26205 [Escherichia coli]